MTIDEAKKVAEIASCADGGCPSCVKEQCEMLTDSFPEFTWTFVYGEGITVEAKP